MSDFNPGRDEVEDIAAMKREGDLSRFLRDQIRAGNARRTAPAKAVPSPKPPGYKPGAWPTGTSPPETPPQQHSPADWQRALDEYREWLQTADHPELDHPTTQRQQCGCPACTPRSN